MITIVIPQTLASGAASVFLVILLVIATALWVYTIIKHIGESEKTYFAGVVITGVFIMFGWVLMLSLPGTPIQLISFVW